MKKTILAFLTILGSIMPGLAQETVTGVVVDKKGNPIPGVWLEIPGTDDHTISDLDGTFTITPTNVFSKKLEATYAGMGSQKKKMKDGMRIVMREHKGWKSVPEKWSWFVEAVAAMPTEGGLFTSERNPNKPAFGLMVGGVKQWGFYVKGVTNYFTSDGQSISEYDGSLIDKQSYDYFSVSGGFIARLGCPLHLYIGAGYAKYQYKIRTLSGEWYKYDRNNVGFHPRRYVSKFRSDLVFDLGFMFRVKHIIFSAGVTGTPWSEFYYYESSNNYSDYDWVVAGNIGIGYAF